MPKGSSSRSRARCAARAGIVQRALVDCVVRLLRRRCLSRDERQALRRALLERRRSPRGVRGQTLRRRLREIDRQIEHGVEHVLAAPPELADVFRQKLEQLRIERRRLAERIARRQDDGSLAGSVLPASRDAASLPPTAKAALQQRLYSGVLPWFAAAYRAAAGEAVPSAAGPAVNVAEHRDSSIDIDEELAAVGARADADWTALSGLPPPCRWDALAWRRAGFLAGYAGADFERAAPQQIVDGLIVRFASAAPAAGCAPGERPKEYLTTWPEILRALGLGNGAGARAKVAQFNAEYDGPIALSEQGGKPRASKARLLAWWNALEQRFDDPARPDHEVE